MRSSRVTDTARLLNTLGLPPRAHSDPGRTGLTIRSDISAAEHEPAPTGVRFTYGPRPGALTLTEAHALQ
jgi:hypothetical protein